MALRGDDLRGHVRAAITAAGEVSTVARAVCPDCDAPAGARCVSLVDIVPVPVPWHTGRTELYNSAIGMGIPWVQGCVYSRGERHGLVVERVTAAGTPTPLLHAARLTGISGRRDPTYLLGLRKDHTTIARRVTSHGSTVADGGPWRKVRFSQRDLASGLMRDVLGAQLCADTPQQARVLLARLRPELMRSYAHPPSPEVEVVEGCLVLAGITEPYPGCWPEREVLRAAQGDLSGLWPYMTETL